MLDLCLPLSQSIEYERTCARLGVRVQRHNWDTGTCLIQSRDLPVIGRVNLISRGPVLTGKADQGVILQDMLGRVRGPLLLNLEDGTRPPGAWQLLDGKPLAMLRLASPEEMRKNLAQKWRNRLNKAERAGLTLVNQPLEASRHAWFLDAETAQQKSRGYRSHPTGFLLAYAKANRGQARLFTALDNGAPIAGLLIFKHGRMATYQAGVTLEAGRRASAHHLLIWQAMTYLQKRGFATLDLGRMDLGTGLAHFKRGTGATEQVLAGSYLMHNWFSRRGPRSNSQGPAMLRLSRPS